MSKKHHPNKSSSKTPNPHPKPSSTTKQPEHSAATTMPSSNPPTAQRLKDQQRLLNLFSDAFGPVLSSDSFHPLLQEIKQALFRRDFGAAFGKEEYLDAYAARWSPTRALCYTDVLARIGGHVDGMMYGAAGGGEEEEDEENEEEEEEETEKSEVEEMSGTTTHDGESSAEPSDEFSPTSTPNKTLKMLSIGGCAAELVAFASHIHSSATSSSSSPPPTTGHITLLDSAPWSHIISLLHQHITSPPPLSKYASASVKAANRPLLTESQISVRFSQTDMLSMEKDQLAQIVGAEEPLLVTLLFTLNELYTNGGIGKTTKLLRTLGQVLPQGSLLLVVDSPGSYSEAAVGKENKKYPMQWLLDHTLLDVKATAGQEYKWEKLESQDSVWFRLPEELSYPIQLENMRYQMHLYRREGNVVSN